MNQLDTDLLLNLDHRLTNLLNDTMDLYEIAGLSRNKATADVLSALMYKLAQASISLDLPVELLLDGVRERVKRMRQDADTLWQTSKGPVRGPGRVNKTR